MNYPKMRFLKERFKNQPRSFYILWGVISLLVLYVLFLFLYLKVIGVYGVAIIKEAVATSEGNDLTYEFIYAGEAYTGVFAGTNRYKIGDKYFVSFSKSNPDYNLLQYNSPVPDCLKDSIGSYWTTLPKCPDPH
ncbi:MAG TPA: hypothetical protein VNS58_32200 [Puia sp.]|nr:hypothetical protein [Puia sp.]